MVTPAETYTQYQAEGVREDLIDVIYMISPTQTPFMNSVPRGVATQRMHEWQIDALDTPNSDPTDASGSGAGTYNAQIEGDNATLQAGVPTTRPNNRLQISTKTAVVSGSVEVADKAGRKSEMAYQLMKRAKELKRDCEGILTSNAASLAGSDTVPRRLGGLRAWIETNTSIGATGANGGFNAGTGIVDAATDGTQRPLAESYVKDVIQAAWDAGGEPTLLMTGSRNKRAFSAFAGNATRIDDSEDKTVVTAIDVYVSDFGSHRVVPSRFSGGQGRVGRDLFVLDPNLISVPYMRPYQQWPLAKTGDNEQRQILVEYTLRVGNEAGIGVVADLTTS